ncbi:phospholipid/cholesterol/gamma-HCH transport system substrate-binding protein [Mycolicibacterium sp. BK556]|uniref:MCE family protein n=1 Tax=Mycobacteriaceae TaxID=1762 RepID=UPI00105FDB08|nr:MULTISPECIES: MCE family protein [Mycobacteriaceae]MBB3601702.1 phospholipid/cholesterol/gamma-HCH transport system substrate-binding protein [Mycolicibacterium sp. BK556]MBB3631454.1 phospholipid/cholesterol/gamma-HCH transport system substrate-binding protein [Mycolicibacterium sp. BK607]MBB3749458.1 phospholipid/cholesterol/gamma-HCH transport system substrate-binding protein [Mycolicibacterium sp. BK634]TDO14323.1 phospholipid/cholesterol/gamma-HCH transport system substrate-binding prot
MADLSRTAYVRIAAAILATVLVVFVVFTYLAYTAAFTSTDKVIVFSPRAGLVMESDAKVKYRGIQIGKVKDIAYVGDQAKLTLAIDSNQLRYVPANAGVRIAGNTIFGAKSVEFTAPAQPTGMSLRPGASVQASSVQLEVNTLFQTLTDVLHKIDPVDLNATLSALGEGLRGHGEDLGALLSGTNQLAAQLNPKMPTVQSDLQKAAAVGNIYADAAPDLVTVFTNTPTISKTVVDEQDNLNASLMSAIGLANNGYDTFAPAQDDYIAAIQRLRAPLKVLGDYSPEYGCLLKAVTKAIRNFAPVLGGTKPGLFTSSNFILGAPNYTYPESLPMVNAGGGPNCRGLPDLPSKQFGGSWYRAPFLVTDNAYIPYEPFTELQVDAPSTLQFLFNGAFAERDDF